MRLCTPFHVALTFLFFLSAGFTAYAQEIIKDGLVAFYPFDGNAQDASGNGYHGTIRGATLTTDRFGDANSAYAFDGTNDMIHFPLPNVGHTDGKATWSGWFKTTKTYSKTTFFLVSRGACGITMVEDKVHCSCEIGRGDRNPVYSETAINDGEWHFVAMTYDNEYLRFYIDCELIGEVKDGAGKIDYDGRLGYSVGSAGAPYEFFEGAIDDVRVYDRALAADELNQLCAQRMPEIPDIIEIPEPDLSPCKCDIDYSDFNIQQISTRPPTQDEPANQPAEGPVQNAVQDRSPLSPVISRPSKEDLTLFPNPTRDVLQFQLKLANELDYTITVHDTKGALVYQKARTATEGFTGSIATAQLKPGVYFFTVTTSESRVTKRFIKQ